MARDLTQIAGDYIQMADDAVLDLGSTFTVSGWARAEMIAAPKSTARNIFSRGGLSSNNSFNLKFYELGSVLPGWIQCKWYDSSGNKFEVFSNGNTVVEDTWQHYCIVRNAASFSVWLDGTLVANASNLIAGTQAGSDTFQFGVSNVLGQALDGQLAEWACWNYAASTDFRAALLAGFSPRFYPRGRLWYVDMRNKLLELDGGIAITNSGSSASAHPKIIYPASPIVTKAAASLRKSPIVCRAG